MNEEPGPRRTLFRGRADSARSPADAEQRFDAEAGAFRGGGEGAGVRGRLARGALDRDQEGAGREPARFVRTGAGAGEGRDQKEGRAEPRRGPAQEAPKGWAIWSSWEYSTSGRSRRCMCTRIMR